MISDTISKHKNTLTDSNKGEKGETLGEPGRYHKPAVKFHWLTLAKCHAVE